MTSELNGEKYIFPSTNKQQCNFLYSIPWYKILIVENIFSSITKTPITSEISFLSISKIPITSEFYGVKYILLSTTTELLNLDDPLTFSSRLSVLNLLFSISNKTITSS